MKIVPMSKVGYWLEEEDEIDLSNCPTDRAAQQEWLDSTKVKKLESRELMNKLNWELEQYKKINNIL